MNTYKITISKNYLEHHGILGQKWGKKNGPPYPLDEKQHSSAEKKAGWKKSLKVSGSKSEGTNRNHKLTDEQKAQIKKALKVGAVAASTALAVYGTYKLGTSGQFAKAISTGKKALSKITPTINPAVTAKIKVAQGVNKAGKEIKDWKRIANSAGKEWYKGVKEGVPKQARVSGETFGKVATGGILWMAGVEVADLMTNGAATSKILTAYNGSTKKDNRVNTSYRKKDEDDD